MEFYYDWISICSLIGYYYNWIVAGDGLNLKTIGNCWDDYSGSGNYTVTSGYEDIYPLVEPAATSFAGDVNEPRVQILNVSIVPSSNGMIKVILYFEAWDDTLLSGAPTADLYCYFAFGSLWSPNIEMEHNWIGSSGEIPPPELSGRSPEDVLSYVNGSWIAEVNESWLETMSIAIYVSDMYCNWARNDSIKPHVAVVRRDPNVVYEADDVTIEAAVFDWSRIANVTLRYYDGSSFKEMAMNYDNRSGLYVAKIPALQEGKRVEYQVIAEDIYGNLAESNVYSYEVKAVGPPSEEIP